MAPKSEKSFANVNRVAQDLTTDNPDNTDLHGSKKLLFSGKSQYESLFI